MKNVIVIRDRGQITIPDSIRKVVSWVSPMSAISITVIKPDEILIQPHQKYVDWDKIWKSIYTSRAIHGKGTKSAAKFLEADRQSH